MASPRAPYGVFEWLTRFARSLAGLFSRSNVGVLQERQKSTHHSPHIERPYFDTMPLPTPLLSHTTTVTLTLPHPANHSNVRRHFVIVSSYFIGSPKMKNFIWWPLRGVRRYTGFGPCSQHTTISTPASQPRAKHNTMQRRFSIVSTNFVGQPKIDTSQIKIQTTVSRPRGGPYGVLNGPCGCPCGCSNSSLALLAR